MRKKPRILILGAGVMQGPALKIAREMGLEPVAADADDKAACISHADHFEKVDLKDKEGIEALARSLMAKGGLGGIMTAGTDFSATVAWVAERLKLPGIGFEAALDASDKGRMRQRFCSAGLPSPNFVIVENLSQGEHQLPFSFPVVVKPVDNMGSRGCRKVDSPEELKAALSCALEFSRSGRAIIEEYMEGPEFSVDALVYKGEITICGLADRHIFFPPYFIEMGHTMPTSIDSASISLLLETFCKGVKALGITDGAAKGDIKLSPRGPMIGEIAARLSGGYMSGWTYPYSSGVLPTKGAIEIALGEKPSRLAPLWNWTSAERAFISIPGKVLSIEGLEMAKVMPGVKDIFLLTKPGSDVNFPVNNVTKCGNVISAAEKREDAVSFAERAARSILIRLQSPNTATDAFLAEAPGKTAFPPDAFPLDSRLLPLLETLPEGTACTDNSNISSFNLVPFPEFTESSITDYLGRSVKESLTAIRALTGMELLFNEKKPAAGNVCLLGRSFWQALIRGGYQGAVYYIDKILENAE